MKKITFSLVALIAVISYFPAHSQGFGIRAGVNFQNINGQDALDNDLENDLITGFNVGVVGEANIAPDFYFQSGALFSVKGTQDKSAILGQDLTSTLRIGYVEVPLNLVYKPMLGNGHILLGFGPYAAFGATGKVKQETSVGENEIDIEFTSSVDENDSEESFYVKRFDSGANLFIGYEFAGGLSFQLNTQLGLVNISPEYSGLDNNTKWNNTGFGLSIGYLFGGE